LLQAPDFSNAPLPTAMTAEPPHSSLLLSINAVAHRTFEVIYNQGGIIPTGAPNHFFPLEQERNVRGILLQEVSFYERALHFGDHMFPEKVRPIQGYAAGPAHGFCV
jgi:hypothetical protein